MELSVLLHQNSIFYFIHIVYDDFNLLLGHQASHCFFKNMSFCCLLEKCQVAAVRWSGEGTANVQWKTRGKDYTCKHHFAFPWRVPQSSEETHTYRWNTSGAVIWKMHRWGRCSRPMLEEEAGQHKGWCKLVTTKATCPLMLKQTSETGCTPAQPFSQQSPLKLHPWAIHFQGFPDQRTVPSLCSPTCAQ